MSERTEVRSTRQRRISWRYRIGVAVAATLLTVVVGWIGSSSPWALLMFGLLVAILVHDLMSARRLGRQEELHLLDINGRVYCGCGASFCMQLERKASREPKKHVKQLVEAFPRSYGNPLPDRLGPGAGEAEPPRRSKRLGKGKGKGHL